MSGFKNSIINRNISEGILKNIMSKVLVCCDMMCNDCLKNEIKVKNLEEDIRDYLYTNYLNDDTIMEQVGLEEFRFFSEVPENYQDSKPKGRTDLQVFNINMFKHRKQYFTIECKRIDGSKTLNKYYIENGIKRFVREEPLYPSFFKVNCMFSFVVKNIDIDENANKISELQLTSYSEISVKSSFSNMKISPDYNYTYESEYKLNQDTDILLYHIFYNFTPIIGE